MLIFILIEIVYTYIYASGQIEMIDHPNNEVCQSGSQIWRTIYFSQSYTNVPQIILYPNRLDIHYQNSEYIINIDSVTTSNFVIKIDCTHNRVYQVILNWFAIDDKRIQVINQFNIVNFQNIKITHSNTNFEKGFISLVSFGYVNAINFEISIDSITDNEVSIKILDQSNGNLLSIGYQIILGTKDAINFIQQSQQLTSNYTSGDIEVQPDSQFILPISGMNYLRIDNIRLNTTYYSQNPINFLFSEWDSGFTGVTQSQVWVKYNSQVFYGLQCIYFTVQLSNQGCQTNNPFKIILKETNSVIQELGTQSLLIDKTISNINLITEIHCNHDTAINRQIIKSLKCIDDCSMNQVQHSCTSLNNLVVYNLKFAVVTESYQSLTISLTESSCEITQKLQNQVETTITLLKIDLT